jgi:hypothetical protein
VTYTGWNWLNSVGEPSGWVLVGAADFDGNGVPDLVWEYMPTGQVTVNYYGGPGGATLLGLELAESTGDPGWTVVAVADMNNDGVPDLIWQNNTTNQVTVNYYGGAGGAVYQSWNWLNSTGEPAGWRRSRGGRFRWQRDAGSGVAIYSDAAGHGELLRRRRGVRRIWAGIGSIAPGIRGGRW